MPLPVPPMTPMVWPFLAVKLISFKVLREYKKYDNDPIFLNEDYIGWKTYKNYRDSLHFDSFILGNSCTMAFLTSDWEKYLNGSNKDIICVPSANVELLSTWRTDDQNLINLWDEVM